LNRLIQVNASAKIRQTTLYTGCFFDRPFRTLSSAVLNGGYQIASQILNLKVDAHTNYSESPESTLQKFSDSQGWQGKTIGLMTSASMTSLRIAHRTVQGVELAVWVTSGLSNLRRVGDLADYQKIDSSPEKSGTINLGLISSIKFSESAMAESLMMLTEAKVAAIHDAKLKSPISNLNATGTGTDSIVVATANDGEAIEYCGKHVLLGQVIGELAYEAISSSFEYKNGKRIYSKIITQAPN